MKKIEFLEDIFDWWKVFDEVSYSFDEVSLMLLLLLVL
jgi:hypothetical protein